MKHLPYLLLLILLLSSCRQVKYIPVESNRLDTVYLQQVRRDSIYHRDSIFVKEKGDTVYLEKYRYLYRDKWKQDTVYIHRTDSVQVPYPVEARLTRWQQMKLELGGWAFGIILTAALGLAVWLLRKKKKTIV